MLKDVPLQRLHLCAETVGFDCDDPLSLALNLRSFHVKYVQLQGNSLLKIITMMLSFGKHPIIQDAGRSWSRVKLPM